MWHDYVLGADMLIAIPARHTMTPTRSQRLGRTPSTIQSQQIAIVMYTPPYAAYTLPLAVGCRESNHANNGTTRDSRSPAVVAKLICFVSTGLTLSSRQDVAHSQKECGKAKPVGDHRGLRNDYSTANDDRRYDREADGQALGRAQVAEIRNNDRGDSLHEKSEPAESTDGFASDPTKLPRELL